MNIRNSPLMHLLSECQKRVISLLPQIVIILHELTVCIYRTIMIRFSRMNFIQLALYYCCFSFDSFLKCHNVFFLHTKSRRLPSSVVVAKM